ncbi:MAG TPA: YjjW family glycine radical enzyme activase [Feifaniaceae bacterium]|nr:YjjW family glycine radical enzyme activase [Feifaniaceae bacterium]
MARKGDVNRILPFSFVDGPGNRSVVFLQGCNLHCAYCHNPETVGRCNGCGDCAGRCPAGALRLAAGQVEWNAGRCVACDTCLQCCGRSASPRTERLTASQVMERLRAALPCISGITVSGGECTLQQEFVAELIARAHALDKTVFLDTNGMLDFRLMPALARTMDRAMLDVKAADPNEHRMLTGEGNETVLKNLEYLMAIEKLYEIRTVIVPGLLDNGRTVETASKMIAGGSVRYKLIRFRAWGVRGPLAGAPPPDDSLMLELADAARRNGVKDIEIV